MGHQQIQSTTEKLGNVSPAVSADSAITGIGVKTTTKTLGYISQSTKENTGLLHDTSYSANKSDPKETGAIAIQHDGLTSTPPYTFSGTSSSSGSNINIFGSAISPSGTHGNTITSITSTGKTAHSSGSGFTLGTRIGSSYTGTHEASLTSGTHAPIVQGSTAGDGVVTSSAGSSESTFGSGVTKNTFATRFGSAGTHGTTGSSAFSTAKSTFSSGTQKTGSAFGGSSTKATGNVFETDTARVDGTNSGTTSSHGTTSGPAFADGFHKNTFHIGSGITGSHGNSGLPALSNGKISNGTSTHKSGSTFRTSSAGDHGISNLSIKGTGAPLTHEIGTGSGDVTSSEGPGFSRTTIGSGVTKSTFTSGYGTSGANKNTGSTFFTSGK